MKTGIILPLLVSAGIAASAWSLDSRNDPAIKSRQGINPEVAAVVNALNIDSIRSFMEGLQGLGTRFMYAENRREVASWIAERFSGFGYTKVELDSFRVAVVGFESDSVWQYNVVAESTGLSAPGEIYILSAHHDDFCMPDPYIPPVPGADDNASGCAVVLEIARVLKSQGFQPHSTIRFVTYAAEEMVGYAHWSGSMYHAEKIHALGEDLRLHICNDMVAWTAGPGYVLGAAVMPGGIFEWAGKLTMSSVDAYSYLEAVPKNGPISDSEWFRHLGYPFAGFMEHGINPTYHTRHDSVVHCNLPLCLEAARATCAILMNEVLTPVPQNPQGNSLKKAVRVAWKPTTNDNVDHFNIYRSSNPDSLFINIGNCSRSTFEYVDSTASGGVKYFYRISSSDASGHESTLSNATFGAVAPKSRDLLVIKDTKGGFNNPADSAVMAFYQTIFKNLAGEFSDASVTDSLDISVLGKYKRIFWFSNSYSDNPHSSINRHREDVLAYVRDGGQLFLSGFQPTWMLNKNIKFDKNFAAADTLFDFYKITSVERTPQACLNGARPEITGYPLLSVDPEKCMGQLPGHLMNLESVKPAPGASVVYSWMTGFDSLTNQGKMKGKPVGIEYLGNDCKLVLISFPLYYMDTAAARELVEFVANQKFVMHTGTQDPWDVPGDKMIQVFPNPAGNLVEVSWHQASAAVVRLSVVDITGRILKIIDGGQRTVGFQRESLTIGDLRPGVYFLVVQTGYSRQSVKFIRE